MPTDATLVWASVALGLGVLLGAVTLLAPSRKIPVERRRWGATPQPTVLSRAATATTTGIARVVDRRGGGRSWSYALDRAGIRRELPEFLLLVGAGVLAAFAVGMVIGGVLAGVALAAVTLLVVFLVVTIKADRRKAEFADQLDDLLQLLATNLRAGHSLLQSFDALSRDLDEPAASEFARVVNQVRVGRDLGEALEETADRMESVDFRWVAQAIAIHRQVGGNLADVLDTVSETIRERNQIRRQVRALSAEGRLSAWVLIALPFFVVLALSVMNPSYLSVFTQRAIGFAMIAVSVVLLAVGSLWLRKVVQVKF